MAAEALNALDSAVVLLDFHGRIAVTNRAWLSLWQENGGPADFEFNGRDYLEVCREAAEMGSGDAAALERELQRILAGDSRGFCLEYPCHTAEEQRWFELRLTPFAVAAKPYVTVSHEDVSLRRMAMEDLRRSEERYALASLGSKDGLWDWDLEADRITLSPRWFSLLGMEPRTAAERSRHWLERVHPEDRERFEQALATHVAGNSSHFEVEHRLIAGSGRWTWVLARGLAVRDGNGHAYRMAGSLTNIHTRKLQEEELRQQALYDALTGLANRDLFIENLEKALARQTRMPEFRFAVLFLDLDDFKRVNDELGHQAGDEILRAFSSRLRECVRPEDTVARLGGDEFTVLLIDVRTDTQAAEIARRILEACRADVRIDGQDVSVTCSIGIVPCTGQYRTTEVILHESDRAMYEVKFGRKGGFHFAARA